jgi:hypothetical protein
MKCNNKEFICIIFSLLWSVFFHFRMIALYTVAVVDVVVRMNEALASAGI